MRDPKNVDLILESNEPPVHEIPLKRGSNPLNGLGAEKDHLCECYGVMPPKIAFY
jgi:hypothetical protein